MAADRVDFAWSMALSEQVLRKAADALVSGKDAALDTCTARRFPSREGIRLGVKRQHCSVHGKQATCQVLVSLTLARKGGCPYRSPCGRTCLKTGRIA